jgi:hypothetical protein
VSLIGGAIFAFSLTGLAYDAFVLRRLYLTNVIGVLLFNLSTPLRFIIADSRAWQNFAQWLTQ